MTGLGGAKKKRNQLLMSSLLPPLNLYLYFVFEFVNTNTKIAEPTIHKLPPPTLIKLIKKNELPSPTLNSHHQVQVLLAYSQQ